MKINQLKRYDKSFIGLMENCALGEWMKAGEVLSVCREDAKEYRELLARYDSLMGAYNGSKELLKVSDSQLKRLEQKYNALFDDIKRSVKYHEKAAEHWQNQYAEVKVKYIKEKARARKIHRRYFAFLCGIVIGITVGINLFFT